MGVSSTNNRVVDAGDGTTTTFSFPYYFFNTTDIQVWIYDLILGGTIKKTLGTDYTISGTPNFQGLYPNGANVVFGAAPSATSLVVIFRNPPQQQNYSLNQNGLISSSAMVQQLDYLTLLVQRLEDQVSRAVTFSDGMGPAVNGVLPANLPLNPLSYLQVNALGTGLQLAQGAGAWNQVSFSYTQMAFAALTGSLPVFNLPPGGMLTGLVIKHSTAFSGGAVSDVTAQLGITGNAGLFLPNFDIFQPVADGVFDSVFMNYIASWANSTAINLTVNSVGANLNQLTQGALNVFYQYQIV